jgi:hypothetical protein
MSGLKKACENWILETLTHHKLGCLTRPLKPYPSLFPSVEICVDREASSIPRGSATPVVNSEERRILGIVGFASRKSGYASVDDKSEGGCFVLDRLLIQRRARPSASLFCTG